MPTKKKKIDEQPKAQPQVPAIRRTFTGEVVGVAEAKTIRVRVETVKMHAKYRKQYKTARKFAVHDETGKAKLGDMVVFEECRPISKTKRWRLTQVMSS